MSVEQVPSRLVAALHREGCIAYQALIVGHAARLKGLAVAIQTSNRAGHVWRPGHVPDAAMTALQQMVGHQAAGLQIIHHHIVGAEVGKVAQEEDKRDPGSLQRCRCGPSEPAPGSIRRLASTATWPGSASACFIFGRVAQEQAIANRMGRALNRVHDGRVDRAGAVRDDQAEGLGRARRQCLRDRAGHIVQPFGNRQDPGPRFGAEFSLVVQRRDTVVCETPASLATSWMVTGTGATSD